MAPITTKDKETRPQTEPAARIRAKDGNGRLRAEVGVTAYYFPQVRAVVDKLTARFDHSLMLGWATDPKATEQFEKPIIEKIIQKYGPMTEGLADFPNRYATAGSSEGILHALARIKRDEPDAIVYTYPGEYQGYREYAKALGLSFMELADPHSAPKPGYWFVSDPSAVDGNIKLNGYVAEPGKAGHKVMLDITYMGSTEPYTGPLTNPSIHTVFVSFSKPYGVFGYRIGFTYSREPIESLEANRWFKNLFSLRLADELLEQFAPDTLVELYRPWQRTVVAQLREQTGLPFVASDVVLLATLDPSYFLTPEQKALVAPYQRGEGYRFCLTPYFLELEAPHSGEKPQAGEKDEVD